jgi:hypothetical protein
MPLTLTNTDMFLIGLGVVILFAATYMFLIFRNKQTIIPPESVGTSTASQPTLSTPIDNNSVGYGVVEVNHKADKKIKKQPKKTKPTESEIIENFEQDSQKLLNDLVQREHEKHIQQYKDDDFGYMRAEPYNPLKNRRKKLSIAYLKDWWTWRKHASRVLIVNIQLMNGYRTQFLVKEDMGSFVYKGKRYIIDTSLKYFLLTAGCFALDYHEELSLPINKEIDIKKVKDTISAVKGKGVLYSLNPSSMQQFVSAQIARQILSAAELDAVLKRMQLMLLITLIASIIAVIIALQQSGAFAGVTGG